LAHEHQAAGGFGKISGVEARPNISIQILMNAHRNLPAVIASVTALSAAGATSPSTVTYAAERRSAGLAVTGGGIDGGGEHDPQPVSEVAYPLAAGTLTFEHTITWRSVDHEAARKALTEAGYFWTRGGPTHPEGQRHRNHLKVAARNAEEALAQVRIVIDAAGGDSTDLEVVEGDPERRRRMVAAIREHQRSAR
jgi:hypothetical protein